jgi:hypothetical protein
VAALLAELADPAAVSRHRALVAGARPHPSRWPFLVVAVVVLIGLGLLMTVSSRNGASANTTSVTALGRTTP